MQRDQIIQWAFDAGFDTYNGWRDDGTTSSYFEAWPEQLERFADLVRSAAMEEARVPYPLSVPDVHKAIRDAGGIVHSDGNIFFTRAEQFIVAAVFCGESARGSPLHSALRPQWPSTPAQIRDFIGSNFISRKDEKPAPDGSPTWAGEATENDVYTLSAHDLLSAFAEWAEAQADAKERAE